MVIGQPVSLVRLRWYSISSTIKTAMHMKWFANVVAGDWQQ